MTFREIIPLSSIAVVPAPVMVACVWVVSVVFPEVGGGGIRGGGVFVVSLFVVVVVERGSSEVGGPDSSSALMAPVYFIEGLF